MTKPQLLLLDEPLSNLDAKLREEMRQEICELTRSLNITTLYVTHDQIEALTLSDKIAVIMDGVIVEIANPRELYIRPQTLRAGQFIGTTNILEGLMVECNDRAGEVNTEIGHLNVVSSAGVHKGDQVSVMVRPESVVCYQEPQDLTNTFSGVVEETLFIGNHFAVRIRIKQKLIQALVETKEPLVEGQTVYVHLPSELCIAMK